MNDESTANATAREEESTRKRNTLARAAFYRLGRFLEENAAALKEQKRTYQQLADLAAGTLGFPVTSANVAFAIEELELDIPRPGAPPTADERIEALEQRVESLSKRVEDQAHLLKKLHRVALDQQLAAMKTESEVARLSGAVPTPEVEQVV